MDEPSQQLTIGDFAAAAGVSIETVRYYQRRGLVRQPAKPGGGIRRYGRADVERVRFVKAAQHLGFSLDEVAVLLQLEDGTRCAHARDLAEHKLDDVRARLAGLHSIESLLAELVRECRDAGGTVACPLIEALRRT